MTSMPNTAGLAALSVLAGMFTLGLTDNFVPFITTDSSLAQFHLLRSACAILMILTAAAFGFGVIRPKRPLAVLARSALVTASMIIYFGCLALMPIGVVVAGLFTAPLFVVIISVVLQGKQVGAVRWGAVVVGFIGTMAVIQPDPHALDWVVFLPILAGLFYACSAVATRAWCEGEGTMALTLGFFGLLGVCGVIGCAFLPNTGTGAEGFPLRGWTPLTLSNLLWIAVQAVGALVGIGFLFRAYQIGEASYVAVFEYSLLIFASFWAFLIWGDTVNGLGVVGMIMIAAAGSVIVIRSQQ